MAAVDWLAVAAGFGAIGWINWYFFLAERRAAAATTAAGAPAGATHDDREHGAGPDHHR